MRRKKLQKIVERWEQYFLELKDETVAIAKIEREIKSPWFKTFLHDAEIRKYLPFFETLDNKKS